MIHKRRDVFITKQGSICRYIGGGKYLNKKCLSFFAKNFLNHSSYVYAFPDGSNEQFVSKQY